MRAGEYDLYLEQGVDFRRVLTLYNEEGTVLDLSFCKIFMEIRQNSKSGVILQPKISILSPSILGKIEVIITHQQTSGLFSVGRFYDEIAMPRYTYDVYIANLDNLRRRVLNGFVKISPEVTKIDG